MNDWHYGGGFAPYDEEGERAYYFDITNKAAKEPDPHAGHEIVKNVANFKEFLYCRDCKVEVGT